MTNKWLPVLLSFSIALALGACATQKSQKARDPAASDTTASDAQWRYVERKTPHVDAHYWQLQANEEVEPVEPVDVTDQRERVQKDEVCPAGMVYVEGQMRLGDPRRGSVEGLQELDTVCRDWMDPPKAYPRRCARFDEGAWQKIAQTLPQEKKKRSYCMDRFEYPNQKGAYPAIDLNWYEAKAICEDDGKRLCTEDEWTFACEGPDALPYPYGYVRSAELCNIDKPWRDFNKVRLSPRSEAADGLTALWQGEPSGVRPGCKSVFGVYDMAGNVDEWTQSTSSSGFKSILKGGYWSVVRNRCRPSTRAHNEGHEFYQQGFRCCSSPAAPSS